MKLKLFKVKYKDGGSVLILADRICYDEFMNMHRFYQGPKEVFSEFNLWIKPNGILMTELD